LLGRGIFRHLAPLATDDFLKLHRVERVRAIWFGVILQALIVVKHKESGVCLRIAIGKPPRKKFRASRIPPPEWAFHSRAACSFFSRMTQKRFKAIVAMSLNRAIGREGKLPWHLPEELRWFKKMTTGHVIVMGRKTWEAIGRPLPNRESIVVTRAELPNVRTVRSLAEIDPGSDPRDYFVIGGAQLFKEALPMCSDVYLTVVKREVEGDVFLDRFEHLFAEPALVQDKPDFAIWHYERR
jgi:dihydrofolate reductase